MLKRTRLWVASLRERSSLFGPMLLGLGLLFFAYRFINFDLCAFICDEPTLLAVSRSARLMHQFPTHSPLVGSQPLQYGPTAVWLFILVHRWLGSSVETFTLVMAVLGTCSSAVLAISVGRFFGSRYVIPATLAALVASSPYLFFWSRMAWEPFVNICTGFAVALLCTRHSIGTVRAVALGALLGFGLSAHPQMLPLALVVSLMIPMRSASTMRLRNFVAATATTAAINLPYLYYVAEYHFASRSPSSAPVRHFSWPLLSRFLTEPLRVLSSARVSYYFENAWAGFIREHGFSAALSRLSTLVVPFSAWLIGTGFVVAIVVHRRYPQRLLAVAAVLVWLGYGGFYSWLRLEPHPHYQYGVWWVVLVGIASLLHLARRLPSVYVASLVVSWSLIVVQTGFLVDWMHFIRKHEGTRGIYYGVPLGYQEVAVRTLCQQAGAQVYVLNKTNVFNHALQYVSSVEPLCAYKSVQFRGNLASRTAADDVWTLSYGKGDSARLKWSRLH